MKVEDGEIVDAGTEIAVGIKAKEKSMVSIISGLTAEVGAIDITDDDVEVEIEEDIELSSKSIELLIRPVQEYDITPKEVNIAFNTTEDLIEIVPVTQLQYRDGARIRQLEGASLTRVSLVLQMSGYLSHLKGLVELTSKDSEDQNLKIVVLDNLIVRRETETGSREKASLQTELLVKSGQIIESKTPVSKTQVLARNDAKVSLGAAEKAEMRRLLLISPESKEIINLKTAPVVKEGDLVSLDQIISESGEKSQIAGQILEVNKNELVIHTSRPYLISQGAQLQVDNESLVQRGDFLATLVFERQKTGDIVQGLPRVEELLEGRKPKESAILAEENGEAVLEYEEDAVRLFLAGETGRQEIKVPIDSSIIVTDKQKIKQGQPLTSGPLNPHDVVRLSGVEAVQQYLLDEVQRVYRSQGVEIADKHVEVIVRQMSKKVKVDESGDTKLLPGELTEMHTVEVENKAVAELGGEQATWHPVLLGITKASLNTESFISAASFQETTRVLTEAAVEGKKDILRGIKEKVIIGRLIPAGTGYYHLTHSSEDLEEEERKRRNRNSARKPSAILEEIEGLFGAPDFSIEEAMGAVIQEDVEDLEDLSEETETVEETEE